MSVKHSGLLLRQDSGISPAGLLLPLAAATVFGVGRGLIELIAIYRHNVSGAGIVHYVIWYYCLGCWGGVLLRHCGGVSVSMARVLGSCGIALGVVPPVVDAALGIPLQAYRYMYDWHPLFLFSGGTPGELVAIWGGIAGAAVLAGWQSRSMVCAIRTGAAFWLLLMAIGSWLPMLARAGGADAGGWQTLLLSAALIAFTAFAEVTPVWTGPGAGSVAVSRGLVWAASGGALIQIDQNATIAFWMLTPVVLHLDGKHDASRFFSASWVLALFQLLQIDPSWVVVLAGGGTFLRWISRLQLPHSDMILVPMFLAVWLVVSWRSGWGIGSEFGWLLLSCAFALGTPWERTGLAVTVLLAAGAVIPVLVGVVPEMYRVFIAIVCAVVMLPLAIVPRGRRRIAVAVGTATVMSLAGVMR